MIYAWHDVTKYTTTNSVLQLIRVACRESRENRGFWGKSVSAIMVSPLRIIGFQATFLDLMQFVLYLITLLFIELNCNWVVDRSITPSQKAFALSEGLICTLGAFWMLMKPPLFHPSALSSFSCCCWSHLQCNKAMMGVPFNWAFHLIFSD